MSDAKYTNLLSHDGQFTPPYMVFDARGSLVAMTRNEETGFIFPVPYLVPAAFIAELYRAHSSVEIWRTDEYKPSPFSPI